MLFGFTIGTLYAVYGFNKQGESPNIDCTCGPFRKGTLYLCGHHIHHWMVAAPCGVAACSLAILFPWARVLGCLDLATFCSVMTAHGLLYPDRCTTKVIEKEVEIESKELEA